LAPTVGIAATGFGIRAGSFNFSIDKISKFFIDKISKFFIDKISKFCGCQRQLPNRKQQKSRRKCLRVDSRLIRSLESDP
jgi:hypothetical protein